MARNCKKSYKDLICKITLLAEFSAELGVPVQLGEIEWDSTDYTLQLIVLERLINLITVKEKELALKYLESKNHYKMYKFMKWQSCYVTTMKYYLDFKPK